MLPKASMTENDHIALDSDLSLKSIHFPHYIPVQVTAVASIADNFIP